ncbi:MAG: GxxExxY protein [Planctomycetota bacterium]
MRNWWLATAPVYSPRRSRRPQRVSNELTKEFSDAAIQVHRVLGPGVLESIYEVPLGFKAELHQVTNRRQADLGVIDAKHRIHRRT